MPSFDLTRFIAAQAPVIARAMEELAAGKKQGHWMWFVFPQVSGLGHSAVAQRYAIASLDEARAYLADPVLGPRLKDCTELVINIDGRSAHQIFGSPDDMKFHSSMTLFARAAPDDPLFVAALDKYFDGQEDVSTLRLLKDSAPDGL